MNVTERTTVLFPTCTVLVLFSAYQKYAPCDDHSSLVDDAWQKSGQLVASAPAWDLDSPESEKAWLAAIQGCRKQFKRLESSAHPETCIDLFVRKFGSHDDLHDLAWLLACPDAFIDWGGPWSLHRVGDSRREVQLNVAKSQLDMFLGSTDLLGRYCELVLWSDCLEGSKFGYWVDSTAQDLGDPQSYSWGARNALVLMYATGRADLISEIGADDVGRVFQQWHEWLAENGSFLSYQEELRGWRIVKQLKEANLGYIPFHRDGRLSPHEHAGFPFLRWKSVSPVPAKVILESL